jgi:hypothetical protein
MTPDAEEDSEEGKMHDVIVEESDSDDWQSGKRDGAKDKEGDLGEREIPYADEPKQRLKIMLRYSEINLTKIVYIFVCNKIFLQINIAI